MYWKTSGKNNTDETIALAVKRAKELNLEHIVFRLIPYNQTL